MPQALIPKPPHALTLAEIAARGLPFEEKMNGIDTNVLLRLLLATPLSSPGMADKRPTN